MTPQTSFMPIFNRLREKCHNCFELLGDRMLVERVVVDSEVTKEVTGKDGKKIEIILSGGSQEKSRIDGINLGGAIFVRVLEVGKGYSHIDPNDGEKYTPLDSKVGAILLVAGIESVKWWSHIFNLVQVGQQSIGIMSEDQILMRWHDDANFNEYMRLARIGFNQ